MITLGALGVIAVGSFLPWAQLETAFGTESANGLDGGGVITLLAAVVGAALLALLGRRREKGHVVIGTLGAMAAAGVSLLVGVANLADVAETNQQVFLGRVAPGVGLILVVVGGLAAGTTGLIALIRGLNRLA